MDIGFEIERIFMYLVDQKRQQQGWSQERLAGLAFKGERKRPIDKYQSLLHKSPNTGKPQSLTLSDIHKLAKALGYAPAALVWEVYQVAERGDFKNQYCAEYGGSGTELGKRGNGVA